MARCAVYSCGRPNERENCWLMTICRTSLLVGHYGLRWERSHASWTGGRSPSSLSSWRPGAAENQHGRPRSGNRSDHAEAGSSHSGSSVIRPAPARASPFRQGILCSLGEIRDCAGASRLPVHRTLPGLENGGRRRGFRGARQPFGNASLTQTSNGSQTSGKPVGALPRTGNAHEPVQRALDTTSTGPAMCWAPPLHWG
jgi:hypothetical protein